MPKNPNKILAVGYPLGVVAQMVHLKQANMIHVVMMVAILLIMDVAQIKSIEENTQVILAVGLVHGDVALMEL